nr:aminotransferase class I/II-fold pyridoxal phosphate-dependent enzyme [Chloroflexota bacterium]
MTATSEPGVSRFLTERVSKIPGSGIRRYFDMISGMEGVISLGVGEPDFVTPEPLRDAAIASIRAGRTAYTSNYGLIELRERLAGHLRRLYDISYDPHTEILISVGVSEALDITCRAVLGPGDEIIVPDPSYVAYVPAVVLADAVPVLVPTSVETQFAPTAEEIERHITPRTKALLLGYPNNPTGAVLPRAELERIAAVAQRHDLLVIADEIYD